MSATDLADRSVYEERYDKITVELCRLREEMVSSVLGERPPLDSRGDADPASGYYTYSVFYFQFVEALAGERWQERDKTIDGWMAEDEARDRRLASAEPAVTPYCRSCGEDMQITLRSYLHRDRAGSTEDSILFMLDCKPCHKRLALWQDGTEWEGYQARCAECGGVVEETDKRRGNVITSTYTCGNCGHSHKSTLRLDAKPEAEPDPYFKLDRRRFCFDAATGKKFLARKAHLEHIGALLEEGRQHAGIGGAVSVDPVAEAVQAIKRLKIAQVSDLLAKAVTKASYSEFKLGEPQIAREVAVSFGCLDTNPNRESYDSRMGLKKLITDTLADTNWRLMSDGTQHRLGYLSGRLRAYESEDDLRKLVEKQVKSGARQKPAAAPPLRPVGPPVPTQSVPTKQSSRGRPKRSLRVRSVLHPNLHMLIPSREPQGPAERSKRSGSKRA